MSEAYSKSQELLAEVRRCHPEWLAEKGDRQLAQRLLHDWRRTKSGFWNHVRRNPDREAAQIAELPGEDLEIARAHANAQRKLMENSGNSGRKLATPLNNVKSVLHVWPPGYSGAAVHPWRINAWSSMSQALSIPTHPYREWLAADLNVMAALRDGGTWLRFWFDEVREDRMPRFWLRWAFEHLQMFAAVTLGTPGDAQLGTYLPEAEFFLVCGQEFHTNDGYAAALRALSALP